MGAVRAGEGILISTYKQEQAKDLSEVAKINKLIH
nr:type VI secretion system Vgr family protein [Acinetobacter indicus]